MNISAVSQTSTASPAATANGAASTSDPLGFFTALQDQLSTSTAESSSSAGEIAAPLEAGTALPALPVPRTIGFDPGAETAHPAATGAAEGATAETTQVAATDAVEATSAPPATRATPTADFSASPEVASLLVRLGDDLEALKDQLDAGEAPGADLLDRLDANLDAVAALLAPPAPPVTSTAAPVATGEDGVSAVSATSAGTGSTPATRPALDELTALLASIRSSASAATPTATSSTPTPDGPAEPSTTKKASDGPILIVPDNAFGDSAAADRISALIEKLKAGRSTAGTSSIVATSDAAASETSAPRTPQQTAGTPQQIATAAPVTAQIPVPPARQQGADVSPSVGAPPEADGAGLADTSSAPTQLELATDPGSGVAVTTDLKRRPEAGDDVVAAVPTGDAKPADTADSSDVSAQPVAAPAASATTARALPTPYQTATQSSVDLEQIAVQIVRQAHKGESRFTIRLDPAELGRVEVKLHVDSSGGVNAQLTVDRAETLDLFQRDRSTLERALAQAGLDAGRTSLEFSLRQDSFAQQQQQFGGQREQNSGSNAPAYATPVEEQAPLSTLYRGTIARSGVDLVV